MSVLARKIEKFDLGGHNTDLLIRAGEILIPKLDEVLSDFYKRALADPDSKAFFESDGRVDFARSAQKKHWIRLLSGDIGDDYVQSVARIGKTHARIKLPMDVYMSAYASSTSQMLVILAREGQGRWFRRGRDMSKLIDVVNRAFAFDIEQVTTSTFVVGAEEQERALRYLNVAIDALAEGDLAHRIPSAEHSDYPADHDGLRHKMNFALESLAEIIAQVGVTMDKMLDSVAHVNASAEDLSHRTNSQAASLEETAAAMEEITSSIRQSTQATQKSNDVAQSARGEMDRSAEVVGRTAEAMAAIKASSEQISRITGLIDDIAFQTNLLALNAGVEAARAGDAGRGFAVVAGEVRSLAANSSQAAKDIKELISESGEQVKNGVKLVAAARASLEDLGKSFEQVASLSAEVCQASEEQAQGLGEVNTSVATLDDITQQNATMVEQTNEQMRKVSQNAQAMKTILAELNTGQRTEARHVSDVAPVSENTSNVVVLDTYVPTPPTKPDNTEVWSEF
jgi:methyl-accepting chemotaxis protein